MSFSRPMAAFASVVEVESPDSDSQLPGAASLDFRARVRSGVSGLAQARGQLELVVTLSGRRFHLPWGVLIA